LLGIKDDGRGNLEGVLLPITAEKVVELNTHIKADVKNKAPRIFEELKREELRFVQILENTRERRQVAGRETCFCIIKCRKKWPCSCDMILISNGNNKRSGRRTWCKY